MRGNSVFSPHIFIYKPQINSVFSLFLRFILILLFLDFFIYSLNLPNLSFLFRFLFNNFVDLLLLTEIIFGFYVLAILGEEFIDYESMNLNYWDIDLITFFRFFFIFFIILFVILLLFVALKFIFWAASITY